MKNKLHSALTLATLLTLNLRAADLGDPAAKLQISEWVKGSPVSLDDTKGKKFLVVEFWATWCGPCRESIPHLTKLQEKFKDKDVVFMGISDETLSKVRPFVDNMGKKMEYTVALDKNRKTSEGYMSAYGINGIPHAFVVDKQNRIAWHGHPMAGLDKVLDRLVSNTYDLAAEKKRAGAQQKLEEYFQLAAEGGNSEKLDQLGEELTTLDKEIGGIEPGEKLDLTELRKMARFQSLMGEYQKAMAGGKSDAELETLEKQLAPLAPKGFKFTEFKSQMQLQRLFQNYYRAVTVAGNQEKAAELAKKLESTESTSKEMLNQFAWTILTDESIKTRDVKLALKLAKAAVDASVGKDEDILDTYARALYDNGKVTEAVAEQKKAIALTDDTAKKAEFQKALDRYQGKAKAD
jgi:thiol-disulfide isomerase/thioredoxin